MRGTTRQFVVSLTASAALAVPAPSPAAFGQGTRISPFGGFGANQSQWFEARSEQRLTLNSSEQLRLDLEFWVVLRMHAERSAPVRTPSLMPGVVLGWLPYVSVLPGQMRRVETIVQLRHHSNGQAGSFWNADRDEVPVGADCDSRAVRGPTPLCKVEHGSGSFSTNYLELQVRAKRSQLASEDSPGTSSSTVGSIGVEWHPGFNQTSQLERRYGLWRLNGLLECDRATRFGLVRLRYSHIYILDRDPFGPPGRNVLAPEVQWFPRASSDGLGLFIGAYSGQDYYNVRFDQRLRQVQVGLTTG